MTFLRKFQKKERKNCQRKSDFFRALDLALGIKVASLVVFLFFLFFFLFIESKSSNNFFWFYLFNF